MAEQSENLRAVKLRKGGSRGTRKIEGGQTDRGGGDGYRDSGADKGR